MAKKELIIHPRGAGKTTKMKEAEVPESIMAGILPLCKQLREVKDQKEKLATETKKLNEKEDYLEQMLTTKIVAEGLDLVRTIYGTASISKDVEYPSVKGEDWDKLFNWIAKHKRFELLSHSLKTAAWAEAKDAGEVIPFVDIFKKDKLSFRRTPSKGTAATA